MHAPEDSSGERTKRYREMMAHHSADLNTPDHGGHACGITFGQAKGDVDACMYVGD